VEAARTIRESLDAVSRLREAVGADAGLRKSLSDVKRLQGRRFAGTYADLLRDRTYSEPAAFFLRELYGEKDFAQRDSQFARIAGAIERFFPEQVARTAASLAHLHALTEDLDVQMARILQLEQPASTPAGRYVAAWRQLGQQQERRQQLEAVVTLGHELAGLTRAPGLRTMLRMMRRPAAGAGLGVLQGFLEVGFDTFARMARQPGAVEYFLKTISQREEVLMQLLYAGDLVACETELHRILGQAP
jgi:hypothetical protein